MTDLLTLAAIFLASGLWIIGFHSATREGMVLPLERWWGAQAINAKVKIQLAAQDAIKCAEWIESTWNEDCPEGYKWNGMTFEDAKELLYHKNKEVSRIASEVDSIPIISKPLSECPTCMSSVHGQMWAIPTAVLLGLPWWICPLWSVCLAGLVEVLTGLSGWKGGGE